MKLHFFLAVSYASLKPLKEKVSIVLEPLAEVALIFACEDFLISSIIATSSSYFVSQAKLSSVSNLNSFLSMATLTLEDVL